MISEDNDILVKSIKPNFKTIGPKFGKQMKAIAQTILGWTAADISNVETNAGWTGSINGEQIHLDLNDFVIHTQDIPGWMVANEDGLTVALDISISPNLKSEGIARELVNRVQNLRKDKGLEVTDRIHLTIETSDIIQSAIEKNKSYISDEVLAASIVFKSHLEEMQIETIETEHDLKIHLEKK
jgi:isoleucyl-tRNA synthetase